MVQNAFKWLKDNNQSGKKGLFKDIRETVMSGHACVNSCVCVIVC